MHLLLALPDEQLLRIMTLTIYPVDFDVAAAAHVLGQSACPIKTSSLLRELHRLGLAEVAPSRGQWRLHAAVRDAAIELAAKLQLPLIAARCFFHPPQPGCLNMTLTEQAAHIYCEPGTPLVSS